MFDRSTQGLTEETREKNACKATGCPTDAPFQIIMKIVSLCGVLLVLSVSSWHAHGQNLRACDIDFGRAENFELLDQVEWKIPNQSRARYYLRVKPKLIDLATIISIVSIFREKCNRAVDVAVLFYDKKNIELKDPANPFDPQSVASDPTRAYFDLNPADGIDELLFLERQGESRSWFLVKFIKDGYCVTKADRPSR